MYFTFLWDHPYVHKTFRKANLFYPLIRMRTRKFCVRSKWMTPFDASQPEITCSKLTIETLEQGVKYVQSCRSGIFIVNFEHISYLVLPELICSFFCWIIVLRFCIQDVMILLYQDNKKRLLYVEGIFFEDQYFVNSDKNILVMIYNCTCENIFQLIVK